MAFTARTSVPFRLGIASGKGGVGKSALAVNIGLASAALGVRTLLVDADAGLANADLLMGIAPRHDLADWHSGRVTLGAVLTPVADGMGLIVAGPRHASLDRLREACLGGDDPALASLLTEHDLVLFDLAAGIGPNVIDLAVECDATWLVATPEPTSLADAYATAKRIWQVAPNAVVELVVNRAPDRLSGERTHQALSRMAERFLSRSIPLRAVLQEDPAMLQAVARQRAVVVDRPRAPIARRLQLLAESLEGELGGSATSRARPSIDRRRAV